MNVCVLCCIKMRTLRCSWVGGLVEEAFYCCFYCEKTHTWAVRCVVWHFLNSVVLFDREGLHNIPSCAQARICFLKAIFIAVHSVLLLTLIFVICRVPQFTMGVSISQIKKWYMLRSLNVVYFTACMHLWRFLVRWSICLSSVWCIDDKCNL